MKSGQDQCTVAFDDDRNDLGYLDDNGKIVINQEKLAPWFRGIEILDTHMTGCPIHGMPVVTSLSPQSRKTISLKVV